MTQDEVNEFEINADTYWDAFYNIHQNKFFKDRHWLFTEFPELKSRKNLQTTASTSSELIESNEKFNIFEIGCGVGNTIFPILKYNTDENLQLFGCDFSSCAINILRSNDEFNSNRCNVFVLDATEENWHEIVPFQENSINIIVMIFVLSAIQPDK